MNSTLLWALTALLASLAPLAVLALGDAKRLRGVARLDGGGRQPLPPTMRRVLALGVFIPGFALAVFGFWSAVLIWLGTTLVLGWALARILAPRPRRGLA